MPDQPSTAYLGKEKLFKVGDLVVYRAQPYWVAGTSTFWGAIEGLVGIVKEIRPTSFVFSERGTDHPWKYSILFDGHTSNLTPASENIHTVVLIPEWEL